jgi:hypothetical protein
MKQLAQGVPLAWEGLAVNQGRRSAGSEAGSRWSVAEDVPAGSLPGQESAAGAHDH